MANKKKTPNTTANAAKTLKAASREKSRVSQRLKPRAPAFDSETTPVAAPSAVESATTERVMESQSDEVGAASPTRLATRDPRLPPAGSVLVKRDRWGIARCECAVEVEGIRYQRTLYRSLSAAATAAARDLGIAGNQNGYVFWGLVTPARSHDKPISRLEKAWNRYTASVKAALATGDETQKSEVRALIERHKEVAVA